MLWKRTRVLLFSLCTPGPVNGAGLLLGVPCRGGSSHCAVCSAGHVGSHWSPLQQQVPGAPPNPGVPMAIPQGQPLLGSWLPHAFQLMDSSAPIFCRTKDSSKYSFSAATAASVPMSISHPHCALCFKSALAANNAFIQADNITKLLVSV